MNRRDFLKATVGLAALPLAMQLELPAVAKGSTPEVLVPPVEKSHSMPSIGADFDGDTRAFFVDYDINSMYVETIRPYLLSNTNRENYYDS